MRSVIAVALLVLACSGCRDLRSLNTVQKTNPKRVPMLPVNEDIVPGTPSSSLSKNGA